ncbi:MAG: ORF6N domain-containing protein, partial [Candidatus Tenebribacter mawsonii]|nr:ORF6N domain-containing protein [Candidatus Tenebribacter mawsonii]
TIRTNQVMIDSDLAEMYGVETKNLNLAVKRNIDRFPEKFRFQLTKEEYEKKLRLQFVTSKENSLRSQNATLGKDNKVLRLQNETSKEKRGGRRYLPYAFTEQGVAMLSAVLRSETAIKVSIQIIDAFVEMRKFISQNANLFQRVNNIEQKQIASDVKQIETDTKIDAILDAIEEKEIKPKQGIFFEGQIFDAYKFVSDLFRSAKTSILIIDNYVDDTVLTHLTKKKKTVKVSIYTKNLSEQLKLDAEKFNSQYKNLTLKKFNKSHDRFIIIDDKDIYHFGASLKDLGKKWFAFSKFGKGALTILEKLEK